MVGNIKEFKIDAGAAITKNRVLCCGNDGKAYHASWDSGAFFGVSANNVHGNNSGCSFWEPGEWCEMTAGGTITGGDLLYVDNTGSGMVVKYAFTGSSFDAIDTGTDMNLRNQLHHMANVVGVCLQGTTSGNTFKAIFNPIW